MEIAFNITTGEIDAQIIVLIISSYFLTLDYVCRI